MILADTAVWIDHLRKPDEQLSGLLSQKRISIHPYVIGEIALGNLANRAGVLRTLSMLKSSVVATHQEVYSMIHERALFGVGIGYVDAHLLASALVTRHGRLWTRDKRLHAVADRLGIAADIG